MSITPLNHYTIENPATVYDEEALTALQLAARTAAKTNECVEAVNKFVVNVPEYIEDDVRKWLEDHPEATTTVQDKSVGEEKLMDDLLLKVKNVKLSPQMFGAKGDGVTDDTAAIKVMFAHAAKLATAKHFTNEESCADYSNVSFEFAGKYVVNEMIAFSNSYGLTLDGLHLIAGSDFKHWTMLYFGAPTRNLRLANTTINGNLFASTCVTIDGYSLTTEFVNVELTRFKANGLEASGKGHELKMINCKINQVEWGEYENINTMVEGGYGLSLGADRHDNHFVNVIVNYCANNTVYIEGTANTFIGCHFYGSDVINRGLYNVFQNCYFDGVSLDTNGFFTVANCFFNRTGTATSPFINLTEPKENEWRYDQASITGTMFRAQSTVPAAIGVGAIGYIPMMTAYGNTFYYVEPFVVQSKGTCPNPWQQPMKHTGDDAGGYVTIAGVKFIWGTASADGFQIYPDGVTLTHTFFVDIEKSTSDGQTTVYANDIRADRFYLNNTGGKTYKWLVIGR